MTTIDARGWAKRNLWRLSSQETCVRPGLRRIYTPDNGKEIVGGFSVTNEFTQEQWHYVFDVATSGTKALRLSIFDENFATFQILSIKADAVPRVITHAVVEGQIIVCSPSFPTLWGLVGSSMRLAVKVESDNTSTTAVNVPRGICAAWTNRVVICDGASMYFSDPIATTGGDARTYVAENINQRPGVVYGVHEGAGGMLVVETSAGVYGLDSSAAAAGIVGSNGTDWRLLNHHKATSWASSAVVRGRVFGLSRDGFILIDEESTEETTLTEPVQPRAYGPRISLDDYRTCRIYAGDFGPIVANDANNAIFMTDLIHDKKSWWTSSHSPTSFVLRGVLHEPDGTPLLLCSNGAFRYDGNFDGEVALTSGVASQPRGVLFGVIPTTPAVSQTVRHVYVAAEAGGSGAIYAAVRGSPSQIVPLADGQGITIGTDAWGTTAKRYTTTPITDARFAFSPTESTAQRDIGLEVAVDGCLARIMTDIDVDMSESAPRRPTNTTETAIPSFDTIADSAAATGTAFSLVPTIENSSGYTLSYSLIGTLPAGLSINSSTGTITGTPTTIGTTTGLVVALTYSGKITGVVYSNDFSILVYTVPSIASIPELDPFIDEVFSYAPVVTNPSAFTLVYSITGGTLPTGLSISATTGVISGTPTTGGTTSGLSVHIVYTYGTVDSNTFTVVVEDSPRYVFANHYNSSTSVVLDSTTLSSSNAFLTLTKTDDTLAVLWATKLCDRKDTKGISPWIRVDRATGNIYFAVMVDQAGSGDFFQAGSMSSVATRTRSIGTQPMIGMYDKDGVLKWIRKIHYTVTGASAVEVSMAGPAMGVLSTGNLAVIVRVKAGNSGNTAGTTVTLRGTGIIGVDDVEDATNATICTLSEEGADCYEGAFFVLNALGNLVVGKAATRQTSSGSQGDAAGLAMTPYSSAANGPTFGFNRERARSIIFGPADPNALTSSGAGSDSSIFFSSLLKYSEAGVFQWVADEQPLVAGSPLLDIDTRSVAQDSSGNIYNTGQMNNETAQTSVTVLGRSAGLTSPMADTNVPDAANGTFGNPFYVKRSSAGALQWIKSYGPTSTFASASTFGRHLTCISVNDVPYICGVVRDGDVLYLDEGLATQTIINGSTVAVGSETTSVRGFVAKLSASDGTVAAVRVFTGTAGAQGFGADASSGYGPFYGNPFYMCAVGTRRLAVSFDYADTAITIGATTLSPIAAGKSFAPYVVLSAADLSVQVVKKFPSSGQGAATIYRGQGIEYSVT